jgi:electron transfer flavoprotein beta subunit
MRYLVCVKQVPNTAEIRINRETNTLCREGVASILNPFDAFALELALRLRDQIGGEITVLSMGPGSAKTTLRECIALGANHAILLQDRLLSGSDTLATAYALCATIKTLSKKTAFDIIFCGKQAIDGDTAQVGPALAEMLNLPQVTCVTKIKKADTNHSTIQIERDFENGYEVVETEIPALLTVDKLADAVRLPSLKSKMNANRAVIDIMNTTDIHVQSKRLGIKGSPTKVRALYVCNYEKSGTLIDGEDSDKAVQILLEYLEKNPIR